MDTKKESFLFFEEDNEEQITKIKIGGNMGVKIIEQEEKDYDKETK